MDITVNSLDGRTNVAILGEMDADNCTELTNRLFGGDDGVVSSEVLLDLSGLTFLDSSGVSEILRVQDKVAEEGGSLLLANPTSTVYRVFEITGLLDILHVVRSDSNATQD